MNDNTEQRAAASAHIMGPSRVNHGLSQCTKCHATDREIAFALGPVCPVPDATLAAQPAPLGEGEEVRAIFERLLAEWQRVSDALDGIEAGMHADLEDAASDLWSAFEDASSGRFAPEHIEAGNWSLCEACAEPIKVGHVVTIYDDVGGVHVDCDHPYAMSDDPKACVLLGEPTRHYPLPAPAALPTDPVACADEWRTVDTAPAACHVQACRFDEGLGEWVFSIVASPPSRPFVWWKPLDAPPADPWPALSPSSPVEGGG